MVQVPPAATDLPLALATVVVWEALFLGGVVSDVDDAFLGRFEQGLKMREL